MTFATPAVEQVRNDHEYLKDYMAERPLYIAGGSSVSEIDKKLVLTSPRAARTVTPPNEGGLRPLTPRLNRVGTMKDAKPGVPS